jgi:hypothetical protein
LGVIALIGIAYRAFQTESAIYNAIDELHKSLIKPIAENEFNFGVHVAAYCERKERVDYLIHANEEKIDHKANRLFDEIKDLKLQVKQLSRIDKA